MSENPEARVTQVHQIYIKASPQAIWDAITTSEWTTRYGYRGPVDYELKPGGRFQAHSTAAMQSFGLPDVVVDGEVVESDPPRKLVQTYRFLFDAAMTAEGFTRLTWEIAQVSRGFCQLTVTHELAGAPIMAQMVRSPFSEMGTGGWGWILSDLKSVLETGSSLSD